MSEHPIKQGVHIPSHHMGDGLPVVTFVSAEFNSPTPNPRIFELVRSGESQPIAGVRLNMAPKRASSPAPPRPDKSGKSSPAPQRPTTAKVHHTAAAHPSLAQHVGLDGLA